MGRPAPTAAPAPTLVSAPTPVPAPADSPSTSLLFSARSDNNNKDMGVFSLVSVSSVSGGEVGIEEFSLSQEEVFSDIGSYYRGRLEDFIAKQAVTPPVQVRRPLGEHNPS